jgi:hypothetical protein
MNIIECRSRKSLDDQGVVPRGGQFRYAEAIVRPQKAEHSASRIILRRIAVTPRALPEIQPEIQTLNSWA